MIRLDDRTFERIVHLVRTRYGVVLDKKKTLIESRLQSSLEKRGISSFSEYLSILGADESGIELTILLDKLTTNHTFFYREPTHFEFFDESILPWLTDSSVSPERDLRIWCAGCSSGEEPYTLTMQLMESLGSAFRQFDSKILATDLSQHVLTKAKVGIYKKESASKLPSVWRQRYMKPYDDQYLSVDDRIKENVIFRRFNLLEKNYPFKKSFHVIFCRNVMIYFDLETRKELVERFYRQLVPGGFLLISHSENLPPGTGFLQQRTSIYRKPPGR